MTNTTMDQDWTPSDTGLTRRSLVKGMAALSINYGVVASAATAGLGSNSAIADSGGPKVALITGASSGFGYESSKTLARNGYQVIASMRNTSGNNKSIAASLTALANDEGINISVVDIDIDSDESVQTGVAAALSISGGKIDLLFNNAGINIPGPVELSMDAARRNFETNVFGQLRMLRAVAPIIRERRDGLIIQMSSGLGRLVMPTSGLYCATKFAQEALFESAAYELHPFGVEVAIIQPSNYATNIKANSRRYYKEIMNGLDDEDKIRAEAYRQHLKVTETELEDRPAPPPSEVADAVLTLAKTPAGERPLRYVACQAQAGD